MRKSDDNDDDDDDKDDKEVGEMGGEDKKGMNFIYTNL